MKIKLFFYYRGLLKENGLRWFKVAENVFRGFHIRHWAVKDFNQRQWFNVQCHISS